MRSIVPGAAVLALAGCATLYPTADAFEAAVDGWALGGRPVPEALERLTAEGFRCRTEGEPRAHRCERTARTYFCAQWQTIVLVDDGEGQVAAVDRSVRGGLRPLAC